MAFNIKKTTLSELKLIAVDLAAPDAEEVYAAGETPVGFLERAFYASPCIRVVEHDKYGVVAVTGLGHDPQCAWLLNTSAVNQCKLEYLRASGWLWREGFKAATKLLGQPAEFFFNHIWEGHKDHIEWLKWCGATFDVKDTRVYNGNRFIPFMMRKEDLKI